jgi:hypothetical protein
MPGYVFRPILVTAFMVLAYLADCPMNAVTAVIVGAPPACEDRTRLAQVRVQDMALDVAAYPVGRELLHAARL